MPKHVFSISVSIGLFSSLFSLCLAPTAHAQLAGDSVTAAIYYNGYLNTNYWDPANGEVPAGQSDTQTVGPAYWTKNKGIVDSATLESTSLTIVGTAPSTDSWEMVFTDNNPGRTITGVSLDSSTFGPDVDYSFTGNTITINWAGDPRPTITDDGAVAHFDIITQSSSTPEPGSLALVGGLGVTSLLAIRRRRQVK